jgi:hypothetical protein
MFTDSTHTNTRINPFANTHTHNHTHTYIHKHTTAHTHGSTHSHVIQYHTLEILNLTVIRPFTYVQQAKFTARNVSNLLEETDGSE